MKTLAICIKGLLLVGFFFFTNIHISYSLRQNNSIKVFDLKCEYKLNPLGIDSTKPRLFWKIRTSARNMKQTAYEIQASESLETLLSHHDLIWSTGKILSDQSAHVEYSGPPLKSGQRIHWHIRIWDDTGNISEWSNPAYWEMGLLEKSDWKASWIQPDLKEDLEKSNPCPYLRKEFNINKKVKSARIYATCLGLYELHLNNHRVGDQLFTPGWTAYDHRLQYQTYDVTDSLKPGSNALGVILGDGWYRGYLGFNNKRNTYGNNLALLLQLKIEYMDGTQDIVGTDESWKSTTGPILESDIYNGEVYDARLEKTGWAHPGFNDFDWSKVLLPNIKIDNLIAPEGPPVRKIQELFPISIKKTRRGKTIVDLGQNMVGWIRLKVNGKAGDIVTLRHSEVLDKQGNLYLRNLRSAKQTIKYILKGNETETYEPHFTFQGFRYVEIEGFPGSLKKENITGIVIHSDVASTGNFECSENLVNQLQHNILWGLKGNFLDVPTDCPQRDERLGWTGDAQVFARTACFNADVVGFFTRWLKDLAADQQPDGAVPFVIPNVLSHGEGRGASASAGWADAAVIVPWTLYLCYGDTRVLEQQYSSMKAWVEYMRNRAGETFFWKKDFSFGDWLAFNSDRSDYPGATTDKDLICQAYFAYSTSLLHKIASILGHTQDAENYKKLGQKIRKVFQDEFVSPNGRLSSNTQTAYSLALGFDLLPQSLRNKAAQRLAEDVNSFKHITTGFLGTPLVCHVLSDYGYYKEAFYLLLRKEYPSWLYPVTKGATTIWERWDGIKPDGTFQDPGMNSFNHYAYGAIGDWLYRVVTGIEIDPKNPGYKHTIIKPRPAGDLKYARASINSIYGRVSSAWEFKNKIFELNIEIPANTTATVIFEDVKLKDIFEGKLPLAQAEGIIQFQQQENNVLIDLGSGEYKFVYPVK